MNAPVALFEVEVETSSPPKKRKTTPCAPLKRRRPAKTGIQ